MERIMVIFCIVLITSVNSLESKITKIHPLKYNTKALKILAEKFNAPSTFKSYVNPLLIPRVTDSLGIDQAKKFIIKVLKNLNWNVEIDEFQKTTPYGSKTFRNIIATYNTTKPKRLVLAAHYDSKDLSKDGKHFIGATDAAVPCAILLDVVTQLKCLMARGNGRLADDLSVQLVFFDGKEAFVKWTKEDSLYGSRHLAEKWERENKLQNIQMMILLDLIGSSDIHFQSLSKATKPYFEGLVKIEKKLADAGFLNKEGLSRNRTLFHLNRYGHQYYEGIQDDHTPFLARNVTVLPLISVPYPSVWHKVADNKKAIDYAVTDNFNKIFRVFVASFLHLDPTDSACSSKNK